MQTLKRFYAWFSAKFRKQGEKGKVVIVIGILVSLCCSCSAPITNISPSTPTAEASNTSVAGAISSPVVDQTKKSIVIPTIASTDTPEPTDIPVATDTAEIPTSTPKSKMVVHFIDVGQGDSILIQAPGGESILIDGGETESGALDYLKNFEISQLDLIILTHPDSDHLGGIVEVLNKIPVMKVVTNGQPHSTGLYEDFIDTITNAAVEYSEVKRGVKLAYGDLTLDVLNPVSIQDDNMNNNSLVIRLVYGSVSFLLTGDVQAEGETQMLSDKLSLSSTILKVAHHGSQSGSTTEFLEAVHPAITVYTAGLGNPSGNPSPDVLASLAAIGTTIYGTDLNGTIIISTDGTDYLVQTEKQATRAATIVPLTANVTETIVPTFADTEAPTSTAIPELSLSVTSLTSPIATGSKARLVAQTNPGAECDISVILKSGPSQAAGLGPQTAGSDGVCSWSWKIGANTTAGTWKIIVYARLNEQSQSLEIPFEVKK